MKALKIPLKASIPFLFILLFCMALSADSSELAASWERETEGRIWGEYVLNSQNAIYLRHHLGINALCDYRAFEETAAVRKEVLSVLRDFISDDGVSDAAELCGYVLEFCASVGIASLKGEEMMLLSRLLVKKRHVDRDMRLAGNGRRGEGTLAVSEAAVHANPPRRDLRDYILKSNREHSVDSFTDRVNLNIYSLSFDKVDYFSLILYLWEDNPFDRMGHTSCKSRLITIPVFLITHNLQNHLSDKKPKDILNQDSTSRRHTALFCDVLTDFSHKRHPLIDFSGDSDRVFSAVLGSERFRGTGGSS